MAGCRLDSYNSPIRNRPPQSVKFSRYSNAGVKILNRELNNPQTAYPKNDQSEEEEDKNSDDHSVVGEGDWVLRYCEELLFGKDSFSMV